MEPETQGVSLAISGVDIGVISGLFIFIWNQFRLSKKHSNRQTEFETTVKLKITELEKSITDDKKEHENQLFDLKSQLAELYGVIRSQEQRNNEYYNEIKDQLHKNHEVMLDKTDKVFKEILGMIRENEKETSKKFREVHERINDK